MSDSDARRASERLPAESAQLTNKDKGELSPKVTGVSVIMAVFNGERFLEEAIDSVLNQTYKDFEFVIVDDGSSDRTESILAFYSESDPRIRVYRQVNSGPASARNIGLTIARNNFVAIMDADDRMLPGRLERQIQFFDENAGVSVICSYSYLINAGGKRIGTSQNDVNAAAGVKELNPAKFLEIVHPSVMMKKRDILEVGGYRGQFTPLEDRDLWGRLVTSGRVVKLQREFLMEYRLHGSSLSMRGALTNNATERSIDINVLRRLKGQLDLPLQELQDLLDSRPLLQKYNESRKFFAMRFYKNATRMYAERKFGDFVLFFSVALFLRPINTVRRVLMKSMLQ